jgi:hypothetical protein
VKTEEKPNIEEITDRPGGDQINEDYDKQVEELEQQDKFL